MAKHVYSRVGTNEQLVFTKEVNNPELVLMVGDRPDMTYRALPDGTWAQDPGLQLEREIAELDQEVPPWLERHIRYDHGGRTDDPELQAAYDSKQAKKTEREV